MTEAAGRYFGLIIAYVLPGFVVLLGLRPFLPAVDVWLQPSAAFPAGLESIVFVTLLSIGAGMTVSAARWLLIDSLHHYTGLARPPWDDATLESKLDAFLFIVESHYRHYQFYANTTVALAIVFVARSVADGATIGTTLAFVAIEALFIATSRDTLRKYYARTVRLLGLQNPKERKVPHGKRQWPRQADDDVVDPRKAR